MVKLRTFILLVLCLFHPSYANCVKRNARAILNCQEHKNNTLIIERDQEIAKSFSRSSGKQNNVPKSFEASDVVLGPDGKIMYVVFDNTFQIGAFCNHLTTTTTNCKDQLLVWPDSSVQGLASQFEGITYNPIQDTYFVAQEAIPTVDDSSLYQPNIFEIRVSKNDSAADIEIIESCRAAIEFSGDNKGFEGLEFVKHESSGQTYLFGLCEANKCASSIPNNIDNIELGHGRIVVLEKQKATKKKPCAWNVVGKIKLPQSVRFVDYSAVSIYRTESARFPTYIAVTSQENSQLWIGIIEEISTSPFFRVTPLDKDITYDFPQDTLVAGECLTKYCNIEGVTWINQHHLVVISDKSKKTQNDICQEKDQSIHYVTLPEN